MTKQLLKVNLTTATTTQEHTLGAVHCTPEGDEYMYLQADGAVTKDLLYSYDPTSFQIEDPLEVAVIPLTATQQSLCVSSSGSSI